MGLTLKLRAFWMSGRFSCGVAALLWLVVFSAQAETFYQMRGHALSAGDYMALETRRLWEEDAPNSKGSEPEDVPTLTVFRPREPNGASVIIAPGGAYLFLMADYEGREIADWYAARGITAFVLKYRLGPRYGLPDILRDAQRAIRLVRADSARLGLSPQRIGMMGFSAGGHLAALTGTLFDAGNSNATDPVDRQSSRPDFMVLAYPAIQKFFVPDKSGNIGYCQAMQIKSCDPHLLDQFLPAKHVMINTPPAFLYSTGTDEYDEPIVFYRALREAGVATEIHIFEHGAHGSGLGRGDPALDLWPTLLEAWLRERGLLSIDQTLRPPSEHLPNSEIGPSIDSKLSRLLNTPETRAILAHDLGTAWIEDVERYAPSAIIEKWSLRQCVQLLRNVDAERLQSLSHDLANLPRDSSHDF